VHIPPRDYWSCKKEAVILRAVCDDCSIGISSDKLDVFRLIFVQPLSNHSFLILVHQTSHINAVQIWSAIPKRENPKIDRLLEMALPKSQCVFFAAQPDGNVWFVNEIGFVEMFLGPMCDPGDLRSERPRFGEYMRIQWLTGSSCDAQNERLSFQSKINVFRCKEAFGKRKPILNARGYTLAIHAARR
jgi:hypothetical protein